MNILKIIKKRNITFRFFAVISTLILIAGLAVINIFVDKSDFKWDFTADKRYTISDETIKFLKGVDKEVNMVFFFKEAQSIDYIEPVKRNLQEYAKYNKKIRYEFVDPDKQPARSREFGGDPNLNGVVFIKVGDKYEKLEAYDMISQEYGVTYYKIESKLTNTIYRLLENKQSNIYFIKGHGEFSPQYVSIMNQRLDELGYKSQEIDLNTVAEVPKDANILFMIDPKTDISDITKNSIANFLKKGGALYLTLNYSPVNFDVERKNILSLMKEYNIGVANGLVIEKDQDKRHFQFPSFLFPDIENNAVTQKLIARGIRVVVPQSVGLNVLTGSKAVSTVLTKTSVNSWGETGNEISKDEKDVLGPLNLMMVSERDEEVGKKSKVFVSGSSAFMLDQIQDEFRFDLRPNIMLVESVLDWMTDKKDAINIEPKVIKVDTFQPNGRQVLITSIIVVSIPLIILVAWIVVWVKRRRL